LLPEVDQLLVRRLGIDEHRYRSVRWFRTKAGGWRRFEPWMTTLVDLTTGQVLGIVDGRDSAAVGQWLAARSQQWRDGVEVVAIDPSAAFRKALGEHLPRAAVSVEIGRASCRERVSVYAAAVHIKQKLQITDYQHKIIL